jgi:hypothetical protein
VDSLGLSENRKNPDSLLGGCAALMLKLVLRFYWIAGAKIQPAMELCCVVVRRLPSGIRPSSPEEREDLRAVLFYVVPFLAKRLFCHLPGFSIKNFIFNRLYGL